MGILAKLEKRVTKENKKEEVIKETQNKESESQKAMTREQEREEQLVSLLGKVERVIQEEDALFGKSYECPVCYETFKSLTVRTGKVRNVGQDLDLRPVYQDVDPLKYDVIACPHCGYAALNRYFDKMMPAQRKFIREGLKEYKACTYSDVVYSYEDAISRYKLAMVSDSLGDVHESRAAYTALKLAWVFRGKRLSCAGNMSENMNQALQDAERNYLTKAYNGYIKAFSTENFPMSGMDELTLSYLVGALAYELEKYGEALKLISRVLTSKTASARIKDKAYDLKETIRQKVAVQTKE